LKNLDEINHILGSSRKVFLIALIIPIFVGFLGWALATGAVPGHPLWGNYLGVSGLSLAIIAMFALPISYFIKWNWEAKYFGAFLFPFSTGSLMAIYPLLCIVQYGKFSIIVRVSIFVICVAINGWWCIRIIKLYSDLGEDEIFNKIYLEESTEIYYLKKEDEKFLSMQRANYFIPEGKLFVLSMFLALGCLFFSMSKFTGLPSVHLFLAIISFPIGMLFLGVSTKCFLVFYFYPNKIRCKTGKKVYIDTSSYDL
jgi:hypothetical protein